MDKNFPHPFKETLKRQVALFKRLPQRISQWGLLEIKENFRRQGYYNDLGRFIRWRKRKTSVSFKKKQSDAGRALLIKTGRLRRSLRASPVYMTARVVTDVPYAEAQNSGFKGKVNQRVKAFTRRRKGHHGGSISVRGHSRTIKQNIPARPFMVTGKRFLEMVENKVLTELDQIFVNGNRL